MPWYIIENPNVLKHMKIMVSVSKALCILYIIAKHCNVVQTALNNDPNPVAVDRVARENQLIVVFQNQITARRIFDKRRSRRANMLHVIHNNRNNNRNRVILNVANVLRQFHQVMARLGRGARIRRRLG